MSRRTWRRVGFLLQSTSLAAVGVTIAAFSRLVVGTDGADDPHGYGMFFGSIFLLVLSTIGVIGVLGLLVWWRSARDTPLIAYDVFVGLFASQFLQPAFDAATDTPTSRIASLAPLVALLGFVVLTIGAALAVYRSRPVIIAPAGSL